MGYRRVNHKQFQQKEKSKKASMDISLKQKKKKNTFRVYQASGSIENLLTIRWTHNWLHYHTQRQHVNNCTLVCTELSSRVLYRSHSYQ